MQFIGQFYKCIISDPSTNTSAGTRNGANVCGLWLGRKNAVHWGFKIIQLKPLKKALFTQIITKRTFPHSPLKVHSHVDLYLRILPTSNGQNGILNTQELTIFTLSVSQWLWIIHRTCSEWFSLEWLSTNCNSPYENSWQCIWWIIQLIGDIVSVKRCCC